MMKLTEAGDINRIIAAAVVASWTDLMGATHGGSIQIEYGFAPKGTLDFLQVWSSMTRGHWFLTCDYWMSASKFHGTGVHFYNGYRSESLARILGAVMQHQNAFSLPPNLGRKGLLQIAPPTEEESRVAAASVSEAFDRVASGLSEPLPA